MLPCDMIPALIAVCWYHVTKSKYDYSAQPALEAPRADMPEPNHWFLVHTKVTFTRYVPVWHGGD